MCYFRKSGHFGEAANPSNNAQPPTAYFNNATNNFELLARLVAVGPVRPGTKSQDYECRKSFSRRATNERLPLKQRGHEKPSETVQSGRQRNDTKN